MVDNGDIVEALQSYRSAYAENNSDEDAILGIAQCALMIDNIDIAFEFFVRLLIINHEHPWGYLGRGIIMMQTEQRERALADIQKALKLDNPPTEMRIDAAASLNDFGYSELAIEALMPLRDKYFDNEDFRAEWLFGLLVIADLNNPDILTIIDEELEKADKTGEPDPYYHLCNYARMKKSGYHAHIDMLIGALLRSAPELEDRAKLLGLI